MSSRSRARTTSSPARSASPAAAASAASKKKKRTAPAPSATIEREKSPAKKRSTRRNPSSSSKKKNSPAKSPAKRGKSPASKRGRSPAKSPAAAKRGKSPAKRARSPAAAPEVEAVRSPAKKAKTSRSRKSAAPSAGRSRSRSPAAAAKPATKKKAPARKSEAASRRRTTLAASPAAESDSDVEMEDAAAPATPARRAAAAAAAEDVPAAPYSAEAKHGGLGFMPHVTSYPSEPVAARGVSTLLSALSSVNVPAAIFVSPFPADKHQTGRRQSGGGSARKGLTYDEADDDEDEEEAKDEVDVNHRKTLRPTQAQEAAERSRAARSSGSSRKEDTPTVNRARSRLSSSSSKVETAGIEEESEVDTSSSRTSRRSTGASALKSHASVSGGLIRLNSSPAVWVGVALVLIFAAQFLALNATLTTDLLRSKDVLGVQGGVNFVQTKVNEFVNQFIRPYVGATISAALPSCNLACLTASPQWAFILVPVFYFLASFIVRKGYDLSASDAADLPSAALGPISLAQARHARQVFVAVNAFVSALSFWVFFFSSQKYTPEALAALQRPQQPPVVAPVYSNEWAQVFITLISFSWAASDVLCFSTYFSRAHTALWTLILVVSELVFWLKFPASLFSLGSPLVEKFAKVGISYIPAFLASKSVVMPLFVIQVVENLKGFAGVIIAPLGRILLLLVPMAYLCGGFSMYNTLSKETGASWELSLAFLTVVAALSSWESIQNGREIQGKKYAKEQ